MSDDQARAAEQAEQESLSREQRAQQMPDELKVDVDQEKLAAWDEARGDYGLTGEQERPIMTGEGDSSPQSPVEGDAGGDPEQQEQAEREGAEAAERKAASQ